MAASHPSPEELSSAAVTDWGPLAQFPLWSMGSADTCLASDLGRGMHPSIMIPTTPYLVRKRRQKNDIICLLMLILPIHIQHASIFEPICPRDCISRGTCRPGTGAKPHPTRGNPLSSGRLSTGTNVWYKRSHGPTPDQHAKTPDASLAPVFRPLHRERPHLYIGDICTFPPTMCRDENQAPLIVRRL